jgi:hypothetical protein
MMSSFKREKFSFFDNVFSWSFEKLVWKTFFDCAELDPDHAVVLFHGEGLLLEKFGRKTKGLPEALRPL